MVECRFCFCALLTMLASICATAQRDIQIERIVPRKQVALVIGNGAYGRVSTLQNPVNDADAMANRLRELNFDVLLAKDSGRRAMGQKIDEFIGRLGTGGVALFYYAGHGVQVEGENYLIPVDFEGDTESDVRYDAHPLGKIQDRMERSGAQLNILVLDACRNNPFRFGGRSATRGWAAMNAGRGTFVAFATAPGSIADDNVRSGNGLFTQYLLEALGGRGLGLNEIFDYVRTKVDAASSGKQLPWTHSSVVGRYTFLPGEAATVPPVRNPAKAPGMPAERKPVEVKDGTAVHLVLMQTISSATHLENDVVQFTVTEDVKVGDVIVIPKGSSATGKVKVSDPKGRWGKSGRLEFAVNQVQASDGSTIRLRATAARGEANTSGALPLMLGLSGAFIKGKDVSFPTGSAWKAFVDGDSEVRR
jgi:hypothetical protein